MKESRKNNKKVMRLVSKSNIKIRAKIGAVALIALLLFAGVSNVFAADPEYKYGTDPSGDSWEGAINVITNSNGRCWEATTANIQAAIDDFGSGFATGMPGGGTWGRGTVWLPGNTTFMFYNGDMVNMTRGIILEGGGATFRAHGSMTTGEYIIKMNRSCSIRDLTIDLDISNGGSGIHGLSTILIDGDLRIDAENPVEVDNIQIISWNFRESGIHMRCDGKREYLCECTFNNIWTHGLKYGLLLNATGHGVSDGDSYNYSYICENHFNNLYDYHTNYPIYLNRNLSMGNKNAVSTDGNVFSNYLIQYSNTYSSPYVAITVMGRYNRFSGNVWDWGGAVAYNISSDAEKTYLDILGATSGANYVDDGDETMKIDRYYGDITLDTNTTGGEGMMAAAYGYFNSTYTRNINPGAFYTTLSLFGSSPTDVRPIFEIYGNVGGNNNYRGSHAIDSNGDYIIYTTAFNNQNITLDPRMDVVNINDILKLNPRATAPPNPIEGMIYSNSSDNTAYYYDGTQWNDISSSSSGNASLNLIRNSNNIYWAATGPNIQNAINNLNNNSGFVWLPGNTTITTSSTTEIYKNVHVDMQWCTVKPNADFDVFSLHKNAQLVNGKIDADDLASFTSAAILFDGANEIGNSWYSGYGNFGHTYVGNMILQGNEVVGQHPEWMNGTGIKMICDHHSDGEWIIGVLCEHIDIHSFKYGVHLYCPGGSTGESQENYINGNYFSDIDMMQVRFGITTNRNTSYSVTDSSIYGNQFENVVHQINKCTDYAIHSEGDWNEFEILIWDWGLANNTTAAVTLDTYCNTSRLVNLGGSDYIVNNGKKNYHWNRGDWQYGSGNAEGNITTPTTYQHTGRVNADGGLWVSDINQNSSTTGDWKTKSVRFFYYSSGNEPASLLVYGGTQSTDYIGLNVRNDLAQIIANEHICLNPAFDNFVGINMTSVPSSELHVIGTTTVDNILKIVPRATEPTSSSEGMIYSNSTGKVLYWHDGSQWQDISTMGNASLNLIRNSNNNYWIATTANIQLAVDDFGSTFNGGMGSPGGGTWGRGTVWLPGNTTFEFDTAADGIEMPRGIILEGCGATLRAVSALTSGEYIIKANRSCVIRDLTIDVNPCNSGNGITDLACILVDGEAQITGEQTLLVENIHCVSWNWEETAFYLRADTNDEFCNGATFRDCRANGMKYGVRINTQGDGVNISDSGDWSYQNDNLFDRFHDEGSSYPVWLDRNTSESNKNAVSCDGNIFLNLFIQHSLSAEASKEAIHIVGRGHRFVNAHIWDWSGGYVWNITSDAEDTYISCRGGTTGVAWENNGNTTMLMDYGQNNIYLDETFAGGYGSIRAYSSYWTDCDTSRINNDADRDVYFFLGASTDERRFVRITGDVSDTDYDGTLKILSNKNFEISADENITINPSGGTVNIDNTISIDGMEMNGSYSEYDTFICNSNGKYWNWDNTMTPIISAMYDLNNKSGWVKLPPPSVTNTRINDGPDITSTILLTEYCTLYCNDNWFDIKLSQYDHAFEMNIGSVLMDCHVNAKPYYTANASKDWEGAAVFVNGSRHFKWEYGGNYNCRCKVENLYVEADYDDAIWRNNATGLYLSAEGAGYSIQYGIFENIFTQDCKYGIKMMVSGGAGCNINNNYFINCISSTDEYAIYMNGSSEASTEIAQNNFERCIYQCDAVDSGDSPEKGIVVVEGPGNRFEKYMFWDMTTMNPATAVILQLESSAENTYFEATGALLVNNSGGNATLSDATIIDDGDNNMFFIIGYSDFWLDCLTADVLIPLVTANFTQCNTYLKAQSAATEPNIPNDALQLWHNSTSGSRYLIWDDGGTQYYLNFSATI